MEIYTFDKSLQERLVELSEILSSRGAIVPASQIQSEWSYHLELVLEPVGWQTLWKVSRLTCEEFQVHYPTIVVVEVERIDYAELTALVRITAVQDEIHLPDKYDAPLVELYPTLNQGNNVLDMEGTSNCIDQLRFFYNYLWMPWDIDDDDNTDWATLHLETRIRLFFDMKRGTIAKETCDVIRGLIREGREIQQKICKLEDSISDEEEQSDDIVDEGRACQLMKLHFRLQQIKTEMEVLENPAMREVLVRNKNLSLSNAKKRSLGSKEKEVEGYLVWLGGSFDQMKVTMAKAEGLLPSGICLKVSNSLHDTLQVCEPGDVIIVGDGNHQIQDGGNLEEGGSIKGVQDPTSAILSPRETETAPSLLDFSGSQVSLENISLDIGELRVGIIVRSGTTKIVNCRIYSLNESVVKLGIVVLPGAKLVLDNVTFEGLGSAIVIYEKAEVSMTACSFVKCAEAIQIYDNARLEGKRCLMKGLKEYAIRMETQKYLDGTESKCGSIELLENVSELSMHECTFAENGKGDALLRPRSKPVMRQ